MDSIIQDFGEIPDEYLQPAGDGGYNSDEGKDETSNDYENSNFEILHCGKKRPSEKSRKVNSEKRRRLKSIV